MPQYYLIVLVIFRVGGALESGIPRHVDDRCRCRYRRRLRLIFIEMDREKGPNFNFPSFNLDEEDGVWREQCIRRARGGVKEMGFL